MDLNFLVFVFEDLKDLMVVEQVINFASVDFIHRDRYREVPLVVLPVVNAALK